MRLTAKLRRRIDAGALRRSLAVAGVALATFGGLAVAKHAWAAGWIAAATASLRDGVLDATAAAGFVLDEVVVEGQRETPRAAVAAALGVDLGMPLLAVDLDAARLRIEAIGWVRHATVTRRLPRTLAVAIEERRPAALWQNERRLALIDREGAVIARDGIERYPGLPHLVGPDAPRHAAELLDALAKAPEVARRMVSAVRVGQRRWSLNFPRGVKVELPEQDIAVEIARLARHDREAALLARDLQSIDLRQPDRLLLRPAPKPQAQAPTGKRI